MKSFIDDLFEQLEDIKFRFWFSGLVGFLIAIIVGIALLLPKLFVIVFGLGCLWGICYQILTIGVNCKNQNEKEIKND